MSAVIIALIIVAFIIAVFKLIISVDNKEREKAAYEFIAQFHREGKENNLVISKWEMAGQLIIGLEIGTKRIFALQNQFGQQKAYLIELSNVRNCLKRKIYICKVDGNRNNKRFEREFEHISLQFEFVDDRPPVMIAFYHPANNHLSEMAELEQKAKEWELVVQTIIRPN